MVTSKYDKLSPFEFKDTLIKMAESNHDIAMLNAGRGNPNFVATQPRHAFLRLGDFAMQEAERSYAYLSSGFGGMPEPEGIVGRFDTFVAMNEGAPGIDFLQAALSYDFDHLGLTKQDVLMEMTIAFLGCLYPTPPRMLPITEKIVKIYISMQLLGLTTQTDEFDIFATEGATAAMGYLFNTLRVNGMMKAKDKVAIITPIFSPYLEIPLIPEYDFEIVEIMADEHQKWQVPESELKKLEDPKVKMLFMVNPSNPPSVKMCDSFLDAVADFVEHKRPDLMIVTDDVYATFADDYHSFFEACKYNTMCVYSFSKYFGVTGWRLGTMCLHEDNVFDAMLKNLPEEEKKRLDKRYSSLTDSPRDLKFIDRLVADSRSVALNHTAGISLPQQLQMMLLALASILDENGNYQAECKRLIRRRFDILYDAMGLIPEVDENSVDYYTVIDLEDLAKQVYDADFSKWLMKNIPGAEFIVRLAKETSVVLLPGKGFDVHHPSARVSLANLTENDYRAIGTSVKQILEEYFNQFKG